MKKGFTLIELLAVIVILAIIALIATPVILGIIDDTRKSANEQSINLYGKAIENAVANYLLKNPLDKEITLEKIQEYIKYDGNKVDCEIVHINKNGSVYLTKCKAGDNEVEYTYGKKMDSSCYISLDINNDKIADIGDKITCGTESFYVIPNEEGIDNISTISMLAQYTLNTENESLVIQDKDATLTEIIPQIGNEIGAYKNYMNKITKSGVEVSNISSEQYSKIKNYDWACDLNMYYVGSFSIDSNIPLVACSGMDNELSYLNDYGVSASDRCNFYAECIGVRPVIMISVTEIE